MTRFTTVTTGLVLTVSLVVVATTAQGGPRAPRPPLPTGHNAAPSPDDRDDGPADGPDNGSGETYSLDVTLEPRAGITGVQRVNFAVPLAKGQLFDPGRVRVLDGDIELAAGRRELALYPDGSVRSVQIQVDVAVSANRVLHVRLGEEPTTRDLALVPVAETLTPSDGTQGPRVWARLPATWLVASGVTGPQVLESETEGTAYDAWDRVCDFHNHTVDQFLGLQSSKDVWLYDRGTIFYRAYARRGDRLTLESAYRETAIYRARMTGSGSSIRIGVPGSDTDVKYHYAQNLAIHYLLTGDDRFRETAEDIAFRIDALWNPHYRGGGQFWTERHAGFSLLAYVWARIVTDDKAAQLDALAHDAVEAYLDVQATYPRNWTDADHRCFAHETNCSPWMSAILADALDVYATEYGATEYGLPRAAAARTAIVKLGRIMARDGRDSTGKPLYMLGVGSAADTREDYDEHWGEPAYLIAMAYHHGGRTEPWLKNVAEELIANLRARGTSPHMRSFNWQCRSAMAAPYYLR